MRNFLFQFVILWWDIIANLQSLRYIFRGELNAYTHRDNFGVRTGMRWWIIPINKRVRPEDRPWISMEEFHKELDSVAIWKKTVGSS